MRAVTKRTAVAAICCLLLCSCGKREPYRKDTYPVTGEVYVDAQPAAELQVYCHSVAGIDAMDPTVSSALTDKTGKFEISTYESADGVPEGEYVLTFTWKEYSPITGGYDGKDKLDGRYSNPKQSRFRFKVEKQKRTELERIHLSTK